MTEARGDLRAFGRELSERVNPMWLLRTLPNNVLGHIGIKYGLKGTNACITNHSVGGMLAVIEAIEALRAGEADRVVAVGHETPIEPQMVLYYHRLGAARERDAAAVRRARATAACSAKARARWCSRPKRRPRARGAPVLGEVLGGGYATEGAGAARDPRRRRRARRARSRRRSTTRASRRPTSA